MMSSTATRAIAIAALTALLATTVSGQGAEVIEIPNAARASEEKACVGEGEVCGWGKADCCEGNNAQGQSLQCNSLQSGAGNYGKQVCELVEPEQDFISSMTETKAEKNVGQAEKYRPRARRAVIPQGETSYNTAPPTTTKKGRQVGCFKNCGDNSKHGDTCANGNDCHKGKCIGKHCCYYPTVYNKATFACDRDPPVAKKSKPAPSKTVYRPPSREESKETSVQKEQAQKKADELKKAIEILAEKRAEEERARVAEKKRAEVTNVPEKVTTTNVAPGNCIAKGEKCGWAASGNFECCNGSKCRETAGHGSSTKCLSNTTAVPATPRPRTRVQGYEGPVQVQATDKPSATRSRREKIAYQAYETCKADCRKMKS